MTPQTLAGGTFGVGLLSSGLGGIGKVIAGQDQQQAFNYNADITTLNMENQVQANQQRYSTLVGKQGSAYAASGVDLSSGSPLLIMAATAARGAQENKQIVQAGTEQAKLQRYYGKIAAFSGTMGGIGSFLSGMTANATSYGNFLDNPKPTPPPPSSVFGGSYDSGD